MDAKLIMTVKEMQNRQNWLDMRNKGIGGSDAGVIMGSSPWKSRYQLWLEKTGQVQPEDLSEKEAVYWGTVLEQAVADRFVELTGKAVRRSGMMQNTEHPWMLANVDRLIVGESAGLECKTTNAFSSKEWEDDQLPDSYYWQCQHYMMATGLSSWYIAVLIGGQKFDYKEIPRNEEDIQALFGAESEFWNQNVLEHIMPDVDGSDSTTAAIKSQYPNGGETAPFDLPDEAEEIISLYDGLKQQKEEITKAMQEQQNKLCLMLGDNEIGLIGDRKVTWKHQKGRVTVDSKKLRSEYPDIYKACAKQGKDLRVFKV